MNKCKLLGFILMLGSCGIAAADPQNQPTLYLVGYSHLDTEWRWSYPQVIREFLRNTLHNNFALFEKYPDYIFNWTGANRYKLMKEYYPEDYAKLKEYVAAGRWYPNGSALEEGDVDIPSEESIIRQVLYANEFFKDEFGIVPSDFMLPDCFGFPASLPTILNHCGVKGFSTQKLTWGSAVGIPFNVGVWVGPDGRSVLAALNPGAYSSSISSDASNDPKWLQRINEDGRKSGVYIDYRYYGTGDQGGSPGEHSVQMLETSLKSNGPIHVISARADQIFNDLTPDQAAHLPRYKGDLLLTFHSAGSASSEAQQKHWNRENELLADKTERAAVMADWLGALPYEKDRITDAWWRFLPGQFHDLMAGTALPLAYQYAWNDQVLALNEFAGVLKEAAGGVIRGMDTRGPGVSVAIFNPLAIDRTDLVEARVEFPNEAPAFITATGPDGLPVSGQVNDRSGNSGTAVFQARVPAMGFAVDVIQPAPIASNPTPGTREIANQRYRIRLNEAGDIASIYDLINNRELLTAPVRLAFVHERPALYPAWNMDWEDQQKPPYAYVDGPAEISVVEAGPARLGLRVEREAQGSKFVQTILLPQGDSSRIEIRNHIEWQSSGCALKAVFPLSVSNPNATYNWEPGTIERGNNDPKKYEVPSHQWFDLTDADGSYGVSILNRDKYGSDKPDNHTLRLTLLYTPGVRDQFQDQATQDWGTHDFTYAIEGHPGDWRDGNTQWEAAQLNQPLIAFQAPAHDGPLGKVWSFVHVDNPDVKIIAMKKAERANEIIVRLNELSGKPVHAARMTFAAPILSASEVDGQENPLAGVAVQNGDIVFSMEPYQPRAFAIRLAAAQAEKLTPPTSIALDLPFNADAANFDGNRNGLPLDQLPQTIECDGAQFKMAPPDQNNALASSGQTLQLPAGTNRRFCFLAASSDGDVAANFEVGDQTQTLTIQAWDGKIGQWDTRLWKGAVPQLAFQWTNPLAGLAPGFIKPATIAWYADHKKLPDGSNDPYAFAYLFEYSLDVPDGVTSLRLPNDPRIKLMAASIVQDGNADATPAAALIDPIDHHATNPPVISPPGGDFDHVQPVTITPPLYNWQNIRFTTDGTDPTSKSLKYEGRLILGNSATVKAASFSPDNQPSSIASADFHITNKTPPQIESIRFVAGGIHLLFTEPLDKSSAEQASNYSLTPPVAISSAALSDHGDDVLLTLAQPLDESIHYTLQARGIADVSGNVSAAPLSRDLGDLGPVARVDGVHAFDGKSDSIDVGQELLSDPKSAAAHFPIEPEAPWTINFFARLDQKPAEKTTLAGFGNDSDTSGTQRYFVQLNKRLEFWGSNIDIFTDDTYDLGKWQMLTATYDGKTLRLYKNAKLLNESDVQFDKAAPIVRLAPPGPWPDAKRFVGKLAQFELWNRDLDPASIQKLRARMPG